MSAENGDFWAKMPIGWQLDAAMHTLIRQAPTGQGIAALKLYLGLCLKANFNPKATLPSTGCARLSIDRLCELVDLSRPMVIKGLRLLETLAIIENLGGRPAVYRIKDYETARNWTRLPKTFLFKSAQKEFQIRALLDMGCRGRHVLHALQLYLYLASIRDKHTHRANVGYTQISKVLCLTRNAVSRAITLLTAHDLITVRQAEGMTNISRVPTNSYWLRGSAGDPMRAHHVALWKENEAGLARAAFAPFSDLGMKT